MNDNQRYIKSKYIFEPDELAELVRLVVVYFFYLFFIFWVLLFIIFPFRKVRKERNFHLRQTTEWQLLTRIRRSLSLSLSGHQLLIRFVSAGEERERER